MKMQLTVQLLILAVAWAVTLLTIAITPGCAHVCAKTWETGAEYSASPYFGPGYSVRGSVGGELGHTCRSQER